MNNLIINHGDTEDTHMKSEVKKNLSIPVESSF